METDKFTLRSKNFIFVVIANFFYFGSFYFLIPIMPQYVSLLGGNPEQVGLVMGCFTIVAVLFRPYFGKLSDKYGRKKVMLLGSGFFILFPGLYQLTQAIMPLYLVRALHGVAHAGFMAASSAYIADLAPPSRRGEVIGIYGTANVVGMAIFPAWGTAIVKGPENFPLLFMVAAVCALVGFLAVVCLQDVKRQDGMNSKPVSIWEVGRRKAVIIPSLALFSGATAYGAVITFLPLFAPQRGLSDFGLFFTVYAVSTLISRVLVGRLSDHMKRGNVILPFMAVVAVAVFCLPQLDSLGMLGGIGALFGLGFGAFMPTLNALVVDQVSPQERGSALGFFTSFMDLGITAGSIIMGLVSAQWGYAVMFYVTGLVVVGGIIVFAGNRRALEVHSLG
jgi:predicted MFS family arabinose efflux permease